MDMRTATPQDIEEIIRLRLQMLRELTDRLPPELSDTTRSYLAKHLADGSCICALLEMDGAIAAMAMLCCYAEMPYEDNPAGKSAQLSAVYTLPAYRGRGYMEQLLLFLLEEARRRGIKAISAAAERKAMPLYKRVGFQTAQTVMYIEL